MVWIARRELDKLTARLDALETRERVLREFVQPAIWNVLDRLDARSPPAPRLTCLACGETGERGTFALHVDHCVFGGGRLERHECPACGCIFGPEKYLQTPQGLVAADYRQLYTHYSEGDSTEQEIRAFHALEPKPEGVYLNWGAGAWSHSVGRLKAQGWNVWAYEPHAAVANAHVITSPEALAERQFDGVYTHNVLEHLFDPLENLHELSRMLTPQGRIAHATPCYSYRYAFTRFHVFFPIGAAAERLAARAGMRIVGAEDDGEYQVRVFAQG